jgi:hypothetical protein
MMHVSSAGRGFEMALFALIQQTHSMMKMGTPSSAEEGFAGHKRFEMASCVGLSS